ncbi:MAG: hypothetical protein IJZ73_05115 [Clostridia bacterium]|nr:hypothetical protein [Clostridia bacterium]
MEEQNKITKKRHSNKHTLFALCMALLMLLSFAGGYYVHRLTYGKESKTPIDVLNLIEKVGYVYDPETNDYVELDGDKVAEIIAEKFLDQYSTYYTKAEYEKVQAESKGDYSGFGFTWSYKEETDGGISLSSIPVKPLHSTNGNSPAYNAGLKTGDVIESARKSTDTTVTNFSTQQQLVDFLNATEKDVDYVFYLKDKEEPVTIKKTDYKATYVEYYDSENALTFTYEGNDLTNVVTARPTVNLSELNGKTDVFYVILKAFQGNAFGEMERAFAYAKEQGKTKLVLDLRNNGGGSMDVLEKIASLIIDGNGLQVKLVSAVGKNETTHFSTDRDRFDGFIEKISVIANENSASASECLLGAMLYHYGEKYKTAEKEEDRAKYNSTDCTVFGFGRLVIVKNQNGVAKTYGKGIMQTTYQLTSGGALKLTTALLKWPDHSKYQEGTSIHGIGILPKVAVQGANPNDSANAVINSLALARAIATLDEGAIILDPVVTP